MPARTTEHLGATCPWCGAPNNKSTSPEGRKPKPGDLAICVACAQVSEIGGDMRLARLGDAEIARMFRQHPEAGLKLRRMQEAVRTAPERFRQYDGQKKSPATEPEGRQRASEKDRNVQSETLK